MCCLWWWCGTLIQNITIFHLTPVIELQSKAQTQTLHHCRLTLHTVIKCIYQSLNSCTLSWLVCIYDTETVPMLFFNEESNDVEMKFRDSPYLHKLESYAFEVFLCGIIQSFVESLSSQISMSYILLLRYWHIVRIIYPVLKVLTISFCEKQKKMSKTEINCLCCKKLIFIHFIRRTIVILQKSEIFLHKGQWRTV